jgi:ribosomal protein S6--L-glutamate ligase
MDNSTNTTDKRNKVIYLNNPDKVFYSDLDTVIIKSLEEKGIEVKTVELDDINFQVSTGQIDLYIKNDKTEVDGFLAYGYMSPLHYEAYLFIVATFEAIGVPCLHTSSAEKILLNKYLQSLCFAKANVPIPTTFQGYSVQAFKDIANRSFNNTYSILKKLDDYGGDGVKRCESKELIVNAASKLLWNNEYCLMQQYVPDSVGKSVRVLCIEGKAVAVAEYEDKANNFLSNNSYGEFFSLTTLKGNPKYAIYCELGEKAVRSIGDLTIGGVDILDSKERGMVILEVNGFPDIFDIAKASELQIFSLFADAFVRKVESFKKTRECSHAKKLI